jgi:hypothetical protein
MPFPGLALARRREFGEAWNSSEAFTDLRSEVMGLQDLSRNTGTGVRNLNQLKTALSL